MSKNDDCVIALQDIIQSTKNLTPQEKESSIDEYINTIEINKNSENDFTPLCHASKIGDLEVVEILLNKGADPNTLNKNHHSPLFYAAQNGFVDIASKLINHGAHINLQDQEGKTPLMYSAGKGQLPITQHLVEQGGDINIQDKNGNTALLFAFKNLHQEVLQYLINNGADMDIQNNKGVSGNLIKRTVIDTYNKAAKANIGAESLTTAKEKQISTKFRDLVTKSRSQIASKSRG